MTSSIIDAAPRQYSEMRLVMCDSNPHPHESFSYRDVAAAVGSDG